jgi:hypothetical protein
LISDDEADDSAESDVEFNDNNDDDDDQNAILEETLDVVSEDGHTTLNEESDEDLSATPHVSVKTRKTLDISAVKDETRIEFGGDQLFCVRFSKGRFSDRVQKYMPHGEGWKFASCNHFVFDEMFEVVNNDTSKKIWVEFTHPGCDCGLS